MKQDMHVLMEWMELNNLFINIDKTQYIIFKKLATVTSNIAHFVFKNQKIQRTDAAKFLGLLIDENLLWDKHINSICKKIAPIIGVTFRLKNLLDQKSKKSIYYGLIQSRLTYRVVLRPLPRSTTRYMASIWGSATSFRLKPLKILQKRAIKSLFGYKLQTSSKQIFRETGINELEKIITKAQATVCHSIVKGLKICNTNFSLNQEFRRHNTRRRDDIRPTISRSTRYGLNRGGHHSCNPVYS
ncbi:RNA-directed DNA polymerase from mobile element jockey, partial [Frankliniella fusca]